MSSKVLTLLLSLAAQSGVYCVSPAPRAKKLETQEKYCETERGGCAEAFSFKCYGETVQVPATTPTLDGRAVCPVVQSLP